jgi:hypothetical protein
MDQDWKKKEAVKAAKTKCAQAANLLREAKSIFHECDRDIDAMNVGEALEYINEVIE